MASAGATPVMRNRRAAAEIRPTAAVEGSSTVGSSGGDRRCGSPLSGVTVWAEPVAPVGVHGEYGWGPDARAQKLTGRPRPRGEPSATRLSSCFACSFPARSTATVSNPSVMPAEALHQHDGARSAPSLPRIGNLAVGLSHLVSPQSVRWRRRFAGGLFLLDHVGDLPLHPTAHRLLTFPVILLMASWDVPQKTRQEGPIPPPERRRKFDRQTPPTARLVAALIATVPPARHAGPRPTMFPSSGRRPASPRTRRALVAPDTPTPGLCDLADGPIRGGSHGHTEGPSDRTGRWRHHKPHRRRFADVLRDRCPDGRARASEATIQMSRWLSAETIETDTP